MTDSGAIMEAFTTVESVDEDVWDALGGWELMVPGSLAQAQYHDQQAMQRRRIGCFTVCIVASANGSLFLYLVAERHAVPVTARRLLHDQP